MQDQQTDLKDLLFINLSKIDKTTFSNIPEKEKQSKYINDALKVDENLIQKIKALEANNQSIDNTVATNIVQNVKQFLDFASFANLTDEQQKKYLKKLIPNKEFVNKLTAAISNKPNVQDYQVIGMEEEEKVQYHHNIDVISQNGLGVQDLNAFVDWSGIFGSIGFTHCITNNHFTQSNNNNGQEQDSNDPVKLMLDSEDNGFMLNGISMYLYPEKSNSDNDKLSQELKALKDFIKSRKDNKRYAFPFLDWNHFFAIGVEGNNFVILDNSKYLNEEAKQKIISNITKNLGLNHNKELEMEAQKSCLEQKNTGFIALAEGGNSTSDSNNACRYHQGFNTLLWTNNIKTSDINLQPEILHLIDIEARGDNTKQEGQKMLLKAKQFFNAVKSEISVNNNQSKPNVLELQENFLTNYIESKKGFVVIEEAKQVDQKASSTPNGKAAGDKIDEVLTNNCQKATELLKAIQESITKKIQPTLKHNPNMKSNDGGLALETIEEVKEEDAYDAELSNDSIQVILKSKLLQQQQLKSPYNHNQAYKASIFYPQDPNDSKNNLQNDDSLSQLYLYKGEESENSHFISNAYNPFYISAPSATAPRVKKNNVVTNFDNVYEIDISQSSINNNGNNASMLLDTTEGNNETLNHNDNNESMSSGEAGKAEELDETIVVGAKGGIVEYKNNLDNYSIAVNETILGEQSQIPNGNQNVLLEDDRSFEEGNGYSGDGDNSAEPLLQKTQYSHLNGKKNTTPVHVSTSYFVDESKKEDKTTPLIKFFSLITQSIVSFFGPITKWIKGLSQYLGKSQGYNKIAEEEYPKYAASNTSKYQQLLQKAHELESELESELGMNSRSNLNTSRYDSKEQDFQDLSNLIYQSQPEQDYLPDNKDKEFEEYVNKNPNLNVAIVGKRIEDNQVFAIVKDDNNEYSIYKLNGANQIEEPFVSRIKDKQELKQVLKNNKIETNKGIPVLIEMPQEDTIEKFTIELDENEEYKDINKLDSKNFEEDLLGLCKGNADRDIYSEQSLNNVNKGGNQQGSSKASRNPYGRD